MFVEKARRVASAGAVAVVVLDNVRGTSSKDTPIFAMSGDGGGGTATTSDGARENENEDGGKDALANVPAVFLFDAEGSELLRAFEADPGLEVIVSSGGAPANDAKEEEEEQDEVTILFLAISSSG
jgi:mannosidase alpha-like ER degradation enhancer 3